MIFVTGEEHQIIRKVTKFVQQIIIALDLNQLSPIFFVCIASKPFFYFCSWSFLQEPRHKIHKCFHEAHRKQKAFPRMVLLIFWMLPQKARLNFTASCYCGTGK